jgi:hypothetical protein
MTEQEVLRLIQQQRNKNTKYELMGTLTVIGVFYTYLYFKK